MLVCRPLFLAAFLLSLPAFSATVAVLRFHNASTYPELAWVGESVAEHLQLELSGANQIVLDRDERAEGLRRLGLRPDAAYTKATLLKLGQTLGVEYLCYGTVDARAEGTEENLKGSSVQIAAHFLDLRKMHDGKDFSEAGKLTDLSRIEAHLAWQSLVYLAPGTERPVDKYLSSQKLIKLEAEESYARGLLSTSDDQAQKWLLQANILEPRFPGPIYELGRVALRRKDYRKALNWLQQLPPTDPRYPDARFRMGLAAYRSGDLNGAVTYYREVARTLPLNEVYNNLGAAENQLGVNAAIDDFRRAADADPNDPVYLFNLGASLLRWNRFTEAAQQLRAALDHEPDNPTTRNLLAKAERQESTPANAKPLAPDRLKENFDETAYRQLKAMLQPKP